MISIEQYVGKWSDSPDWTDERQANAVAMLNLVNSLLANYPNEVKINPNTDSQVSGLTFGGFRPQNCPQGAPNSSHKQGMAVDIYDPDDALDSWLDDDILSINGLYREAPKSTPHWCHLTTRAPGSGKRTFLP